MSFPTDSPREACGIVGAYLPREDVARITFFGLHALQHRGQESAGIATGDGTQIKVRTAMGLGRRKVEAVFLCCGLLLGVTGSLIGVVLGWAMSWTLTTFELVSFDPGVAAIYFISSVPFRVQASDVLAILAFSMAATLLASWVPARRAARIEVSTALRYD